MILLQSKDRFDDIALFDPATGRLLRHSKRLTPGLTSHALRGHFAHLDGRLVILYRDAGVLHLRIDDADFEITNDVKVDLAQTRTATHVLTITRDGVSVFQWKYNPPILDPSLNIDPTFVAAEDFDFGLFVYNVTRDPARRERIYTRPAKESSPPGNMT